MVSTTLVIGTHTHVPTSDHQILPGGTAYQSDAGMCGDYDSVIGVDPEEPINRFLTGVPQLISNALREYYSIFFWFKMVVMVVALVFTFTIRRRVTLAPAGQFGAATRKLVGVLSIVLWASVAIPARLIGLFT